MSLPRVNTTRYGSFGYAKPIYIVIQMSIWLIKAAEGYHHDSWTGYIARKKREKHRQEVWPYHIFLILKNKPKVGSKWPPMGVSPCTNSALIRRSAMIKTTLL